MTSNVLDITLEVAKKWAETHTEPDKPIIEILSKKSLSPREFIKFLESNTEDAVAYLESLYEVQMMKTLKKMNGTGVSSE